MSFKLNKYIEPDFSQKKFIDAPNAKLVQAPCDKAAPEEFHGTSIYPEYFKVDGEWLFAEESRMDCVPVVKGKKIEVVEFRNLLQGDLCVVGRTEDAEEGIYVHSDCFEHAEDEKDVAFSFRQSRSRETAFSYDYDQLCKLLQHEKENNGYVVWVLGPACSFDVKARENIAKLIDNGYVNAVLAGNALATHDLEAGLLGTALGQDIRTQRAHFNGHYNHIDVINKINTYGSIEKFIEEENINDGVMYACVKNDIPYVLNGSIRDDGPLPEVYEHTYRGQDAIRGHIKKATTVIGLATVLHTISAGNMTPTYRVLEDGSIRPIFFYTIDTSEFAVNKLADRGSLAAKGIVSNVQDFAMNLTRGLGI